jgi:hypothetical protein
VDFGGCIEVKIRRYSQPRFPEYRAAPGNANLSPAAARLIPGGGKYATQIPTPFC